MSNEMNDYSKYIHQSRYARYSEEKGRRETWEETIQRLINFYSEKFPEHKDTLSKDVYNAIVQMKVMPSMRSMMTAGPALARENLAGYNCSFITIDDVRSFSEAIYILMNGTGLGFSVERQFVNKLPSIADELYPSETVIVVHDSKIGWAKAYYELLSLLYIGQIPKWDVSKVRPAGARLKTFGGRASGPAPLVDLFNFTVATFKRAVGRKLTSIECHDIMCKIGEIVVVGGVRRSALISLSNLSDERMRAAKTGQWWEEFGHRALANNSVAYTEKPDIGIFMSEWLSLYNSKSGERGIFNRVAAVKQAKSSGRRETEGYDFGTNPCITGDTLIAVADGRNAVTIKQLVEEGKDIPVYSTNLETRKVEIKYGRNPRLTGRNKDIFKVTLDDGSSFKATENHKVLLKNMQYVEVKDLKKDDSIFPFYSHDSNGYRQISNCGAQMKNGYRRNKRQYRLIHEFHNGFVDSKQFAIHHIDHDSKNDNISNLMVMTHTEHRKLHSDQIKGKNNPYHKMTDQWKFNFASHPGTSNGRYSGWTNIALIEEGKKIFAEYGKITPSLWADHAKKVGCPQFLSNDFRFKSWNNFKNQVCENHKVVSVEYCGKEDVYNITVDDNHNYHIITAWDDDRFIVSSGVCIKNCGEILLRPSELCNLSEVVIRHEDTLDDLKQKVKIATILGTFQSTLTDFSYVRKVWKRNCEEERLLGVSLTGIMDHPVLNGTVDREQNTNNETLISWLKALKDVAITTNKKWADKLGINQSVAITTIKPSGTVSQLVNSASGIHPRYSQYYVRTVRQDKKDPLGIFLKNEGIPCEDDVMKPNDTFVFSFPQKSPDNAIFRNDMTAIEQLEHYLIFKTYWCEHNPSITVYVRENEWIEVGAWVYKNFDKIGGVSFLPHSDHVYKQAPYQEITKEQYEELAAKMPKINWEKFKENEDNVDSVQELACVAGGCEI
jgi:ribonucleotide reductase alpha subunit